MNARAWSHRVRLAVLGVASILAVTVAACGSSKPSTSPSAPTTATTAVVASSTIPARPSAYNIYLVHGGKLMVAGRNAASPATPEVAMRALLAGPQGSLEHDLGMTTSIPPGTTLRGVTVTGDLATVDLSRSFEAGGGSQSMQERTAQVVFTLTQFPGITHVNFKLDGAPVASIGGEGIMVDHVGRDAFANVTPAILVESPTPGDKVTSPMHVRGIANTFEATVNYTITDPEGLILREGYTTATAGTGTWGDFGFDATFTPKRAGMGSVIVYQVSPKDGSRTDITEIPIQM
jgi:germination protein M